MWCVCVCMCVPAHTCVDFNFCLSPPSGHILLILLIILYHINNATAMTKSLTGQVNIKVL